MSEPKTLRLAVGDEVRVYFHPPNPWKSYSEGVVRRVDVITPEGRSFVLEVRKEILLDQPHRIMPNFQDYVRYECRNDFPGRIEVLATAEQSVEREPPSARLSEEGREGFVREADEQHLGELALPSNPETEPTPDAEGHSEAEQVDVEPQPARNQGGLLSSLFGRRE